MKQLPDTNPYRIHLVRLVKTISMEIPMEMPDIVLIQMVLNTEEKIIKFTQWVQTKLDGGKMNATAREIVRAAVWIDDGRTDLP